MTETLHAQEPHQLHRTQDQSQLHGAADPASNSQHQPGDPNSAPSTPNSNATANTATNTGIQQQPAAEQPKKAKRKRITPEQLEDLVGLFEKTDTPSFEIREGLAKKLGMTNREIQVWFQNRRAKANRIKINEQAALHHQQHLQHQQLQQQQQQQQHLQGHHHLGHHHRSNSSNGFGGPHPSLVHSAPATPLQSLPGHHHHHHHHQNNGAMPSSAQEPSSYGFFGSNGSSSPPMSMATPTPRAHHSHGQPSRRPASMYSVGSYGHLHPSQQFPQKPGQFQPQHPSSSASSASAAHYGPSGSHPHNGGHGHSNSFSHPAGPYGMDIILPANSSSSTSLSSSQRPVLLPPPITTVPPRRPGQSMEEYEDSRHAHRHERTMSEGHPAGYISPTSVSPVSPSERHMDTQYRDEHEEDSPTSVTQSSPFANGGNNNSGSANSNRNSASLASFGLKAMVKDRSEEAEPSVIPRERPSASAYYNNPAQAAKNRRSYDDALYDEDQQLMRDSFNMDTRLVISEDEPRPGSAIDLLAYAAAFVQEEEQNKDGKDAEEKRDGLGHLSLSNKRQSFHGPTGYPSKEPFQDDSSRYSSGSMAWEASSPAGSNNDVMPVPRRRGGDDAPYAPRRPRPVTYGGSGFLYDHQESQFLPQSPSSSLGSYSRSLSSASARRLSNRNSTEVGSSGLLLQRGLTRPRRSSSTAASGMMSHMPGSSMPILPPIINENRLLSPAMVPSPQFGASRLTRQDSQGNTSSGGMNGSGGGVTRESPGSDSYSRDSYNESHTSRDDMDIEDEQTEYERQRATKRRSGTASSFFGMGVK